MGTCDYIYLNVYYCVMFIVAARLGAIGLDLVSGWLSVMHTYLYYFPLSLSHIYGRDGLVLVRDSNWRDWVTELGMSNVPPDT